MTKLMTVKEVAGLLGVSPSQVYALVECGKLKAYRLSAKQKGQGGLRFSQAQVDAMLSESETGDSFDAGEYEHLR
ncbi:MAG: helix-turn-helix domain-containing protein [Gemmataceae bacterium]|nr:helix-turn-helix domain-containing protein [Gemmataceae bacterium]